MSQINQPFTPNFFSVLIPYYNEALYLEDTLKSWLNQTRKPERIILVNNNSTDDSEAIARRVLANPGSIEIVFLNETAPGKIHALKTGMQEVNTEFVALSDADTIYPPHYLQLCQTLFTKYSTRISALMALPEFDKPHALGSRLRRRYFLILSKIFRKHTFTGGYGQVFRTGALLEAGGFSEKIWPHVLLDHEIMYRIFKKGLSRYHMNLWCQSSERRIDRRRVRWNLYERLLYQFTPHFRQEWFFYRFLGPRFAKKGLNHIRLREKPWETS